MEGSSRLRRIRLIRLSSHHVGDERVAWELVISKSVIILERLQSDFQSFKIEVCGVCEICEICRVYINT